MLHVALCGCELAKAVMVGGRGTRLGWLFKRHRITARRFSCSGALFSSESAGRVFAVLWFVRHAKGRVSNCIIICLWFLSLHVSGLSPTILY